MQEIMLQLARPTVGRPEPFLAELLGEVTAEVSILRNPPRAPDKNDEKRQGDGYDPVDPEVTAEDVVGFGLTFRCAAATCSGSLFLVFAWC